MHNVSFFCLAEFHVTGSWAITYIAIFFTTLDDRWAHHSSFTEYIVKLLPKTVRVTLDAQKTHTRRNGAD